MTWRHWTNRIFSSGFFWMTVLWLYSYLTGAYSTPEVLQSIYMLAYPISHHFSPLGYLTIILDLALSSYVMTLIYLAYLGARLTLFKRGEEPFPAVLTISLVLVVVSLYVPFREYFWLSLIERQIITTESYGGHGDCSGRKTSSKGEICIVRYLGPEACRTIFGFGATDVSDDEWDHLWEGVYSSRWIARPISSRGGFVWHACFG